MRVVGVKQLKAKLSEYLREVRRGQTFLVTDRDTVIAELRPPRTDAPPPGDSLDHVIDGLVASGHVQAPRASKSGWTWTPQGIGIDHDSVSSILDDLRSDRELP